MTSIFQIERTAYQLRKGLHTETQQSDVVCVLALLNQNNLLQCCPYRTLFESFQQLKPHGSRDNPPKPTHTQPDDSHCKSKLLQLVVSRDFTQATHFLERNCHNRDEYYRNIELRINILLLCGGLHKIDTLQYVVNDNVINRSYTNQIHTDNNTDLILEETLAIRRTKLILVLSQFLQGNLKTAFNMFFQYFHTDPHLLDDTTFIGIDTLIERDEIIIMVNILLLLVISLDQYTNVTDINGVLHILNQFSPSLDILKLATGTNFKDVLEIWNDKFIPSCKLSLLLGPFTEMIQQQMRLKIWNFYLDITKIITFRYLAAMSGIEIDIIRDDFVQKILPDRLDLELQGDNDMVVKVKPNLMGNIIDQLKQNELHIDQYLILHKNENIDMRSAIQRQIESEKLNSQQTNSAHDNTSNDEKNFF